MPSGRCWTPELDGVGLDSNPALRRIERGGDPAAARAEGGVPAAPLSGADGGGGHDVGSRGADGAAHEHPDPDAETIGCSEESDTDVDAMSDGTD